MKKLFYVVLAALFCSCTSGGYTLIGEAQGVTEGDSVMIYSYSDNALRYGAAVASQAGQIEISGTIEKPTVAALVVNDYTLLGVFFLESGDIELMAGKHEGEVMFSGTALNDIYTDYLLKSAELEDRYTALDSDLPRAELRKGQEEIYNDYVALISATVDENVDNLVGAYIFANEEITILEPAEAGSRIAQFSAPVMEEPFMADLAESVESMMHTEVGQPYVDVTLAGADGERVAISELLAKGDYVLLDFWATWCAPCVGELPHLKEAYKEYKDRGLEIYGVSLDRDADSWKAMVDESMPWVNVIDNSEEAAAEKYAIRSIPANFLISPEGIIVAKNLRGEQITTILEEHLQ